MTGNKHIMYHGVYLRKYLREHRIDEGVYTSVYYALRHNPDKLTVEQIVDNVIAEKRMAEGVVKQQSSAPSGKRYHFEAKYTAKGKSMWSMMDDNDYFACRRYIKRHPGCDVEATILKYARHGRKFVSNEEARLGDVFADMKIDGKHVSDLLTKDQYRKFRSFMLRRPESNWKNVFAMAKSGVSHFASSRMFRGVTMVAALNGNMNDVMSVKQYARYHKCDDETAMCAMAKNRGWTFGPDNIRICK